MLLKKPWEIIITDLDIPPSCFPSRIPKPPRGRRTAWRLSGTGCPWWPCTARWRLHTSRRCLPCPCRTPGPRTRLCGGGSDLSSFWESEGFAHRIKATNRSLTICSHHESDSLESGTHTTRVAPRILVMYSHNESDSWIESLWNCLDNENDWLLRVGTGGGGGVPSQWEWLLRVWRPDHTMRATPRSLGFAHIMRVTPEFRVWGIVHIMRVTDYSESGDLLT